MPPVARPLWSILLSLPLVLSACGGREREADVAESAEQRSAAESHFENHGDASVDEGARVAATAEPLTEDAVLEAEEQLGPVTAGEVASVLRAIHTSEIAAAELALGRTKVEPVAAVARQLQREHQALLQQLSNALGEDVRPESSALSRAISVTSDSALAALKTSSAPDDVGVTYVTLQQDAHRQALAAVDRLRSRAEDERLAQLLEETRARLQDHLREVERTMTLVTDTERSTPEHGDPPAEPET